MEVCLMIEGQDGLTWERWRRLLEAAERLGFSGVFRSDHFTNRGPPDKPALELWASLTYAASHTTTLDFGPLVSPITFRLPAITAKVAAAVDDLSAGRLTLSLGAGWQEREHSMFGIPFPPVAERFAMLAEYVQVVKLLLRSDEPVTFTGTYYSLDSAVLLPRPRRPGGPPILIGGNGERRTLPIAARFADEWNAVFAPPVELRRLNARLDELLEECGRPRTAVLRSAMIGAIFARDEMTLQARLAEQGRTLDGVRDRGLIVGTPDMWVQQLRAYADTGISRIMLQWLNQDDIEGLEIIARDVLPHISAASR